MTDRATSDREGPTGDELREAADIQGQLWPAPAPRPTGKFPAAKLAPDFFDHVQRTAFGDLWSRPGLAGPGPVDDHVRRCSPRSATPRS